jgi:hypothetical protein
MAKLKISGKISKRHLIALLEDRVEWLERRVEELERRETVVFVPTVVQPYVPLYGTDKTKDFTITSFGDSSRT